MTPKATILRAAELLKERADLVKESLTVGGPCGTEWDTTDPGYEGAKAQHDELVSVAANLMLYVRTAL